MERWQVELLERVARIEENQNFIKANIADLPQSKQCAEDIASLKKEVADLQTFKDAIQRKIAYIGGVLVTIGMFVPYVFNWIASHIHWKAP